MSSSDALHWSVAFLGRGALYDVPSVNDCSHGAPERTNPVRQQRVDQLVHYFFYRSLDESNGQLTGATNMKFMSKFPASIDSTTCQILLADAINLFLKENFHQARILTRLHMTFSIYVQAGKPSFDWDNLDALMGAGGGVPLWITDISRIINTVETPAEIRTYLKQQTRTVSSCDCLQTNRGLKQTAKAQSREECHRCHETGQGFKRCARCQTVTYCGKDCQVQHWPMHRPHCRVLQGKSVTAKDMETYQKQIFSVQAAQLARDSEPIPALELDENTVDNALEPRLTVSDPEGLELMARRLVKGATENVENNEVGEWAPVDEEHQEAALTGVIAVLRDFLECHPDYDSRCGLLDAHAENLLAPIVDKYLVHQPGWESYTSYLVAKMVSETLRNGSVGESVQDRGREIVPMELVERSVTSFMKELDQNETSIFRRESFSRNEHEGFRLNLQQRLKKVMCRHILANPERLNSCRGFRSICHSSREGEMPAAKKLYWACFMEFIDNYFDRLMELLPGRDE